MLKITIILEIPEEAFEPTKPLLTEIQKNLKPEYLNSIHIRPIPQPSSSFSYSFKVK